MAIFANAVFKGVENRAQGVGGFRSSDAGACAVSALVGLLIHPFLVLVLVGATMGAIYGLRRADHGRSDFAVALLRRLAPGQRVRGLAMKDTRFEPFRWRTL